jgi:hypothetical protein
MGIQPHEVMEGVPPEGMLMYEMGVDKPVQELVCKRLIDARESGGSSRREVSSTHNTQQPEHSLDLGRGALIGEPERRSYCAFLVVLGLE